MNQTTIQRVVTCSGIGLHSGKKVYLALRPASANTGIIFDIHTQDGIRRVSPTPKAVMTTALATTLGTADATVSTVEHLLASVLGLGIDNLIVSVEGGEIPIMDGSAAAFVKLFAEAGIRRLNAPRKVMRVSRPTELHDGIKHIRALPYAGFRVDYTIDFPHPAIGRQQMSMEVTPETFARVANARTFGFFKDVEYLHSHGLARGGSLESVVVLDDKGVMNPEGLRYPGTSSSVTRYWTSSGIWPCSACPFRATSMSAARGISSTTLSSARRKRNGCFSCIDLSLEEARTRKPREKVPAYEGSLALA